MRNVSIAPMQAEGGVFRRSTAARRKVLRAVAQQKGQFTAEGLCRQLPDVSRATVYRTLAELARAGYLCRVLLGDGTLHYRVSPEEHHHHLVCVECDRVVDVAACQVADFAREVALLQGFQPQGHRLEIYGRCPDCQVA